LKFFRKIIAGAFAGRRTLKVCALAHESQRQPE